MRALIQDENRTVIIVSHSLETLKELCDQVMWMHEGEIREIGAPKTVLEHYREYMAG